MMDWTPPPPLACSLTPIHAPTPTYDTLQAKGGLFPWHDESLRELFEQVSEAGVDLVQEELERWQAH